MGAGEVALIVMKLLELVPLFVHEVKNSADVSEKLANAETPADTIALLTEMGKKMDEKP